MLDISGLDVPAQLIIQQAEAMSLAARFPVPQYRESQEPGGATLVPPVAKG